ncbi:MAG: tetratricopeptide repeat protein [Gemmatimonadota bacterium]
MSTFRPLDALSQQWREDPSRTPAAALADALRKRGDLSMATMVALKGLADRPGDLPGLLVLSRIQRERGDLAGARGSLRQALTLDPDHPVLCEAWAELSDSTDALSASEPTPEPIRPVAEASELLFTDDEDVAATPAEPLLSESLAKLYHQQGDVERASEVYRALLDRDPGNADLRSRQEDVEREAEGRRPRAYDAAVSGGMSLREWLATLAAVAPEPPATDTAYDAFYQAPAVPAPDDLADFRAFKDWLKGLDR